MKTILFHYPDLENDKIFIPDSIPNSFGLNDPFIYLKEKLFSLGYDIKTSDDHPLDDCYCVIFHNAPTSSLLPYKKTKHKVEKIKSFIRKKRSGKKIRDLYKECIDKNFKNIAIILWESKAIIPENFDPVLHDKFPSIFTWNKNLVDNKKFFQFYHPIARRLPDIPKIPFKNKKLLVNISRNRYSNESNELYSARRNTIRYFEKNYPADFDLYGMGWNKPVGHWQRMFPWLVKNYTSCRGPIKEKADVMTHYKFALCYENDRAEGWVTEKIFDAMRLGTVPIYWGAPNINELVDPAAFIDRRKFKSEKELAKFIANISENEYNKYIESINNYLKSDKYKLFSSENFADTIIKTLKL